MDIGTVRAVVQEMNSRAPGDQARDAGRGRRSASARHGSAEQSSGPRRNRSRDNGSRGRSSNTRELPTVTLGPQNMLDLGQQFADIHDRIDALERLQRLHAQSITHADEAITANRGAINHLDKDISAYKIFITETHGRIDQYVEQENQKQNDAIEAQRNAVMTLGVQFESFMGVIPPNVESLMQRMKIHDEQFDLLSQHLKPGATVPQPPGLNPGQFNIHTPQEMPSPAPVQDLLRSM